MRRSRPTVTRKRREDAATLQEKEDAATLQEKEAQADRADTTMENLTSNLLGFLMYALQEKPDYRASYGTGPPKELRGYRLR